MNDRPLTRREIRELERLREIAETIAAESVASYVPGSGAGGEIEGTSSIAALMAPFFEEQLGKEAPPPPPPPQTTPSGSIPQVTAHTGPFSAPLLPNPVSTGPVVQPPVTPSPIVAEPVKQPTFTSPVVTPVVPTSAPAPTFSEPPVVAPPPVTPAPVPTASQPLPVIETPQPFASLVQSAQLESLQTAAPASVPVQANPVPPAPLQPESIQPIREPDPIAPVRETSKPQLATRRSRAAEARAAEIETPDKSSEIFRSGAIDIVNDTNSIVIEIPKDITNSTLMVGDSGVVLTTGSITLPTIKPDTGEISLIAAAEAADAALAGEKREFVVTGIAPLPARRHLRSRKRASVFPTRLRKGMGQVYLVLFSAIMTAAVLGMLIAAYMLGFIHF